MSDQPDKEHPPIPAYQMPPALEGAEGKVVQLRQISEKELRTILEAHQEWFESFRKKGEQADLVLADLRKANLVEANLQEANLRFARLQEADLLESMFWPLDLEDAGLFAWLKSACKQLRQGRNWEAAYRDQTMACGAPIPKLPDKSKPGTRPSSMIGVNPS